MVLKKLHIVALDECALAFVYSTDKTNTHLAAISLCGVDNIVGKGKKNIFSLLCLKINDFSIHKEESCMCISISIAQKHNSIIIKPLALNQVVNLGSQLLFCISLHTIGQLVATYKLVNNKYVGRKLGEEHCTPFVTVCFGC